MTTRWQTLAAVSLSLCSLLSCGPSSSELDAAAKRIADLQAENDRLKKDLDELTNGAPRLLATARSASATGDLTTARTTLKRLLERRPDSPEAAEARTLLEEVEARSAEEQKKAAAAKARAEAEAELERARAEKERAAALARATARMKTSRDEIADITWYKDKSSGILGSHLQLYFGRRGTTVQPLRWKIQYQGDDWLFIKSIIIKADDQIFRFDELDPTRDNGAGSVWEWVDDTVDGYRLDTVNAILAAKSTTIRFEGRTYYKDKKLPEDQRQAMRSVIDAFTALGGTLPQ